MIKYIRDAYFAEHAYTLIYLHHLLIGIGKSLFYIFTGSYFLKLGMPLHFVLLFYGLEFGLRGLLAPFGATFLQKVGLIPAMLVSSCFAIGFFGAMSFADEYIWVGFASLVLAAIHGAIYYPFLDILEALYIKEDHNRGKQLSGSLISRALGNMLGAGLSGFFIGQYGFEFALVFGGTCVILGMLPFIYLARIMPPLGKLNPIQVYKFLVDDDFKPLWKPFFGEQLLIIISATMVPIFLYSLTGQMEHVGYLIALAVIVEKIFTLTAGHYIDKSGVLRILNYSRVTHSLVLLSYVFLAKTPLAAFLTESAHKISFNINRTALATAIHQHVRDKHTDRMLMLGTCWQMALCIGELIVLPLYALLAYFIGMNVFYVACFAGMIGVHMIFSYFRDQEKQTTAPDNPDQGRKL